MLNGSKNAVKGTGFLLGALSRGVAETCAHAVASGEDTRAFFIVGGFMAVWIIGYGIVQASAPTMLGASRHALADTVTLARATTCP